MSLSDNSQTSKSLCLLIPGAAAHWQTDCLLGPSGYIRGLYTPTAFPSGVHSESVGLRVSRIHIFLLFHPSIFPMIFRCLSRHFWSDHKVQQTFPMDFQWTNSKPTPKPMEVQRISDGHIQQKSDGSPMDCKKAGLVISIINEKVHK